MGRTKTKRQRTVVPLRNQGKFYGRLFTDGGLLHLEIRRRGRIVVFDLLASVEAGQPIILRDDDVTNSSDSVDAL